MKRFRRGLCLLHQLLREISDEAAYKRYLQNTSRRASTAEWRRFTQERYRRKYENPKCC